MPEKEEIMKILWLCNIMLPAIAKALGLPYSNREGWLSGIYEKICEENRKTAEDGRRISGAEGKSRRIELGICFPVEKMPSGDSVPGNQGRFRIEDTSILCYAFAENLAAPENYDGGLEKRMGEILEDFKPDMVHIFGTEFPHTLAMVRAFGRPERTLVGIQGLCFACAEAYMADLPKRVIERRTFRDRLKRDGILQQQEKFRIRGEREKEALKKVLHITGRTEFDRRETEKINGKAIYHFMNETMRRPFYSGRWEEEKCVPFRIFLSQGDYPLKGFHYMLQAMPEILSHCPEACLYVAGNSVINCRSLKDKIKLSSYGKYLLELIRNYGLEGHVKAIGRLSAEEMKGQFLKSSAFVCPSSLENSPNSLGEAMLLGVPAVAADTGGIPSMMTDGKEGLLYPPGDVKKLAACILRTWEEKDETVKRTEAARTRAWHAHDGNRNYERLLSIYEEILQ